MRYLKLFEDFKSNNLTIEDIIRCVEHSGVAYATIVKDFPNNDPKEPMRVVSVDNDGLVTVEHNGKEYEIDLENVEKIEY